MRLYYEIIATRIATTFHGLSCRRLTAFTVRQTELLQSRYVGSTLAYPLVKPPVPCGVPCTSRDFPKLSAYYSLTPVALIFGKVFYRILLVGCISCLVENSRLPESNRWHTGYKSVVLPTELNRLIRDIPKKGGLNETKKERTPRTTVYGSHFAEYRKLCNGIAVSRTRTTFFVGQISNLLRYHYSTIPYPLIKPPWKRHPN